MPLTTDSPRSPYPNTTVIIIMGTFVPQCLEFVYQPLADIFLRIGYPVRILAIESLGLGPLKLAATTMAGQIFSDNPEERFIVVGHSQGAIHGMDIIAQRPEQVLRVFELGAPFHGTLLANLGKRLSWLPAIGDMAAHSSHLRDVRASGYDPDRIHSLLTIFDELVIPWSASMVVGAHNVVLAPRVMHKLLKGLGLRRSEGVELIHGFADHLFVIWNKQFHAYILAEIDKLERSLLTI